MCDDLKRTIKIRLNEKVGTDSRGRSVWTKPIAPVELELMSTQTLEKIIRSDDEERIAQLHELADGEDGVIACDTTNDKFEVLKDIELEAALRTAANPDDDDKVSKYTLERTGAQDGDQELSLVTTQVLRKALRDPLSKESNEPDSEDSAGGYNPYDKS